MPAPTTDVMKFIAEAVAEGSATEGGRTKLPDAPTPQRRPRGELPTMPFPPSVNHYWRRVGHKTLISARGRAYRKEVVRLCHEPQNLQGDLLFRATYYPPDRRRRDLDNLLKALLDSLQHAGVYSDDSQIKRIDVRFGKVRKGGEVEVELLTLTGDQ